MIKINETYAIGSNPNNTVLMKSRINGNTGETEWSNIKVCSVVDFDGVSEKIVIGIYTD